MIGVKSSNSLNQAYLAGLQSQTSVYGSTIPVYIGRTRGNPLMIWEGYLRQGDGLSGSKKAKAKSAPNYVANVDFLLGHNPIAGVLQFWYNNTTLGLNFLKVSGTVTADAYGGGSYTVTDTDYYFVVGVTADVTYDATFDDYGGPGPVTQRGTYELPLWNVNYAGPNPTNQNGYRQWPAVYQWVPYSGATVKFPPYSVSSIPNFTGTINVYYAQLAPHTFHLGSGDIPVAAIRLAYESILGSGDEYDNTGLFPPAPSLLYQQIEYPEYAGMGSKDLDLGTAGAASAILPEVMGMFTVWPSGDADPADMIEDTFMSGPAQAGTGAAVAYGDIHHGLGCCDFPGTVQKKVGDSGTGDLMTQLTFDLPNTQGNFLLVLASQSGTDTLTISDAATGNNTWTPLMPVGATGRQLWMCTAKAYNTGGHGTTVVIGGGASSHQNLALIEVAGLDTVDGSAVVTTGTGGNYTGLIPTTNNPGENSLILSFLIVPPGDDLAPASFHWENIVQQSDQQIDQRGQLYPGKYSVTYNGLTGAWTGVLIALKNSEPNTFTLPLGNILDDTTMQQTRLQCRAYGLNGSIFMGSQKKASDYLTEFYELANAAPVWSGFVLKSIPYAEQSYAGNGAIYTSPTAAGPVGNLSGDDFIADPGQPPVVVSRSAQVDTPDLQQIQYPNRSSNYDQSVASQPDNGSMTLYGTRKEDPKTYASIQTTEVALLLLGIMIREANIVRNTYKFKLQPKWALLEAMDLVTIPVLSTMPSVNPRTPAILPNPTITLRLTSVELGEDFAVDCEAEPFVYGMRSPLAQSVTAPQPNSPSFGADPGLVNAPIIFEAVIPLSEQSNIAELWLVTSGASPNYGGCICYISTDGGNSYVPLGPRGGLIQGSAPMGVTVGDWPAHASPDTTNDLAVDLTESLGSLDSYQTSDEDNFTYPCYVAGGGAFAIPYELMTYAVADLTATYKYTLKATGGGNHLDRGVFGAPSADVGVDHPSGSKFAFLNPNNPQAPGILAVPLLPTWIGVTLYFKFPAFNTTGGGQYDISDPDLVVYSYTPTGTPGGANPGGVPPGLVTVNGT